MRGGELFKNAEPQALHTKEVSGRIKKHWSTSPGLRGTRADSSLTRLCVPKVRWPANGWVVFEPYSILTESLYSLCPSMALTGMRQRLVRLPEGDSSEDHVCRRGSAHRRHQAAIVMLHSLVGRINFLWLLPDRVLVSPHIMSQATKGNWQVYLCAPSLPNFTCFSPSPWGGAYCPHALHLHAHQVIHVWWMKAWCFGGPLLLNKEEEFRGMKVVSEAGARKDLENMLNSPSSHF